MVYTRIPIHLRNVHNKNRSKYHRSALQSHKLVAQYYFTAASILILLPTQEKYIILPPVLGFPGEFMGFL